MHIPTNRVFRVAQGVNLTNSRRRCAVAWSRKPVGWSESFEGATGGLAERLATMGAKSSERDFPAVHRKAKAC